MELKNLLEKVNQNTGGNLQAAQLIRRAYEFAEKAHQGQKRESGENYIIHPFAAALTLAKLNLDTTTIIAALLHDVLEDTKITPKELEKEFGKEINFLIQGVSKISKIKYKGTGLRVENLRKMTLAMAEDIRVILIKLADRLHNMETLKFLPETKRKRIALETLEIYAPLASRLGMGELKGHLEDLAFPYVYPQEYQWLLKQTQEKYQEREKYLKKIQPILEKALREEKVEDFQIQMRAKHYYSLFKKLQKYDMDFGKIYDLAALRIVVPTVEKCYLILGIIHKLWRPLPGRIKDYIALPKPNGYQSLHTTVFCVDGKITEFQIRTPKMHEEAETGIVAHWAYSEIGKPMNGVKVNEKFAWVKQLKEWQNEVHGSDEFLDSLKIDFFKDRIFVLTPKGDVIDLPEGATPVDFAYQIHSDVGDRCAGAKVNNKMVSLDHVLNSGDVVEIINQKNKKPSPSWLDFAKTNEAKNRIRRYLNITAPKIKSPAIFPTELKISYQDRVGLLKDITSVFYREKININSVENDKKAPFIYIRFTLTNKKSLTPLLTKLKQVKGVEEITIKKSAHLD